MFRGDDGGVGLPPQNIEAEEGVIGSALQDWSVMGEVATLLEPDDFYRDSHATIWREMVDAYGEGVRCDQIVLADRLQLRGMLGVVGGPEALADIQNSVPHAANARFYAEIVRQKAKARHAVEVCNEVLRDAYSNNFTGDQVVEGLEQRAFALSDRRASGDTVHISVAGPEFLEAVRRRRAGEFSGITSGLDDLDDVTCGFQPENLIYLAGRTSMGKTSLALGVLHHQAVNLGVPVLFLSLEMSRAEVFERLAVMRSGVDGEKVRWGRLTEAEVHRLEVASGEISGSPFFVDATPARSMVEIAGNARRYRAREGVAILVVDLINHVRPTGEFKTVREHFTDCSRRFKALARELKIPVLVLAQINRGPEGREKHRPRKSDLKESGSLEEDADLVILVHRPDYYDPNDSPGESVVIVDKNRNGPTRDVRVAFNKPLSRFDNLSRRVDPNF